MNIIITVEDSFCVQRGGSWSDNECFSQVDCRYDVGPDVTYHDNGFRIARRNK